MTRLRISLTNVTGKGATVLAQSLLPAIDGAMAIDTLYLPVADDFSAGIGGRRIIYNRSLPNAVSRVLECTLLAGQFDGPVPLLVMGDLPLATDAPQIVFVQTPHVIANATSNSAADALRYRIARGIFRRNQHRVAAFIVQTPAMREQLCAAYGIAPARVHVIPQPPPEWLLIGGTRRSHAHRAPGDPLRLFYPARAYPHKNHALLAGIETPEWPSLVASVTLTIAPVPDTPFWLHATGNLEPAQIIAAYAATDALLFLSRAESYGFPLVEAMWLGLPILCPDLPYARTLCGDTAMYFDPDSQDSLRAAVQTLQSRLDVGWWPDWNERLATLPKSWADVAIAMRGIVESV